MFDNVMLVASCYNTFTQAFYAAFGNPTSPYSIVVGLFVEFMFLLDFVFCFC